MTLLLDTHSVLWFWWDDPQLSETAATWGHLYKRLALFVWGGS